MITLSLIMLRMYYTPVMIDVRSISIGLPSLAIPQRLRREKLFGLNAPGSLPCVCVFAAFYACAID